MQFEIRLVQKAAPAAYEQVSGPHGGPQAGGRTQASRNGLQLPALAVAPLCILGVEGENGEPRLGVPAADFLEDAGQNGLVARILLAVVAADEVSQARPPESRGSLRRGGP